MRIDRTVNSHSLRLSSTIAGMTVIMEIVEVKISYHGLLANDASCSKYCFGVKTVEEQ